MEMIEDRLSYNLMNKGYRRVDSNVSGIYLFYRVEEDSTKVISIIHAGTDMGITKEAYRHIISRIKQNFESSQEIKLLGLILTTDLNQARLLCNDIQEDTHWIIELLGRRLIIYETQMSQEFEELRRDLEQILYEDETASKADMGSTTGNPYGRYENGSYGSEGYGSGGYGSEGYGSGEYGNRGYRHQSPYPGQKVQLFSLCNTLLVILNMVIFLALRYTKLLGGQEVAVSAGALSWYFVKEESEYYRLLTSMFLHSNWNHLINNMLVLLFVGDNLERAAGKLRYLIIYFGSGILAGITSISYNMWKDYAVFSYGHTTFSIGASGAIFGVVGAMLWIVIVNRGRLEHLNTRQMIMFVLFSLYGGISNSRIDQAAHIGGFLAGFVLAAIIYRRPGRKPRTGFEGIQE